MSEKIKAPPTTDQLRKIKPICRFCLSQDPAILSGIFDKNYKRFKPCAPLPIQVLACTSIEIFYNDGMPVTVCDRCRMILDYCYRIKLICKKSDIILRQYPLTKTLPKPISLPRIPDEIIKTQLAVAPGITRLSIPRPLPSPVQETKYVTSTYASSNLRHLHRSQPPMEPNVNSHELQSNGRGVISKQNYYQHT